MNILLTGASRGIGAAARTALITSGNQVAGQSTQGGDSLLAADFTDPAAPRALWEQALRALGGRIHVLVNNAGIFEPFDLGSDDDAWHRDWARTMAVNLQAAADLSRLAIAHFRENGGGRIVNVASRAAYRGDSPAHWHYAASKAGMVAMTKSIARGFAQEDILAFAVSPGFTVTEMTEEYLASRGGEKILAEIPLGRVASADEIGEIVRWLATEAPPSATGTVVDANGASYVR